MTVYSTGLSLFLNLRLHFKRIWKNPTFGTNKNLSIAVFSIRLEFEQLVATPFLRLWSNFGEVLKSFIRNFGTNVKINVSHMFDVKNRQQDDCTSVGT